MPKFQRGREESARLERSIGEALRISGDKAAAIDALAVWSRISVQSGKAIRITPNCGPSLAHR